MAHAATIDATTAITPAPATETQTKFIGPAIDATEPGRVTMT